MSITPERPSVAMIERYFAALEQHARGLEKARHRDMMAMFIRHMRSELVELDLEATMATLHPDSRYAFHGLGDQAPTAGAGGLTLSSLAGIRAFYVRAFQAGAGQSATAAIHRIMVDNDCIAQIATQISTGERVATNYPSTARFIDLTRSCVLTKEIAAFIPFKEGLMAGEILYFAGPYSAADVHYLD